VALLSPSALAGKAAKGAVRVTATGVGLAAASASVTAGLVAGSARVGARAVRAAAETAAGVATESVELARNAGVEGVRIAGTLATGSDPVADGRLARAAEVARAMFEPPQARHSRRVWAGRGRTHVELAAPAVESRDVGRAVRRQLERLDGVEWADVNDVVGRVLVAFDHKRVRVEDVVGVVTAVEQARGGKQVFPQREEHPSDIEPLVAAIITAAVDVTAVGLAYAGKVLPVPALTRHATITLSLLDSQQWIIKAITDRIGPVGTDLLFTGASALLHSLTQSPTIPALNAAAAVQRALEVYARREVWRRREPELCQPAPEDESDEPLTPPGERPVPLRPGPIESYRSRLGPAAPAAAIGLLALTGRPGRSGDLLKALTPKAAAQGREAFAALLDLLMCRRGVLPMDGSAYRRLDRIDTVVVDSAALCTGPPVVVRAQAAAEGWDDGRVWTTAAGLLGASSDHEQDGDGVRLGPAEVSEDAPGCRVRGLLDGDERVGTVVVACELDPHAEALLKSVTEAGHRLVLTEHTGTRELAGLTNEVADADESLLDTVRRLQADGRGVLLVSAVDGPGLTAADLGVAPARPECPPAWGADLVTGTGLVDACRIVAATERARALSENAVTFALTGNVLGSLLAAVGTERRGQKEATTPGKTATTVTMALGSWEALRLNAQPPPPATVHTPWHALEPEQVLRRLADLPSGPGDRREPSRARPRELPVVRMLARFARTVAAELSDPLTPVLGTGALATAILDEATDAVLVGGVMVGNALVSGLQRLRAETALESLLLQQEVVAHRETDGGREDVPAGELEVGDVLLVEAADVVAADARLLEAVDLEADESTLTGESLPVAKSAAATPGADVPDRTCMLFDGTTVVAGTGRAVVVAVGDATQAGRAATAAGSAPPPAGVQARLGELTRSVLPLTLAGGAAVAGLGVLWRRPLREAVRAGVAVAVAAVPEGLPLVATVAQQAAARRLSRRGAVVRSARVLEALGRVDTVCFDKTGTLTENRLQVVRLVPLGSDGGPSEDELLRVAADAVGPRDDHAHETDRAIGEAAAERGVLATAEPDSALPFTTGRAFSAALRDGRLAVKGAPEVVLRRCSETGTGTGTETRTAWERAQQLAAEGLRVLAVAEREAADHPEDLDAAARELTLRGLVALADTVRPSTVTAVEQLRAAGVRVLVATGDHPETAAAIAAQAGVPDADRVVTGAQLARASDAERTRMVREAAVFARLSPEQKVTLVAALRRAGATLAMTGDGVNDAAAIRLADVGVGVAGAESPAARKSADVVLTDVDLTRLVDAIGEGRAMWLRVRDAVSILVGGNAGEVTFTVLGTAFGGRSPLGTRQLLLVNLLTDMFPALAVAVATPRRARGAGPDSGPLAGHPLENVLLAGPHRGFTRSVRQMVLVRGAATAAGAGGAWAVGRLTGLNGRASTMGLAALITTQLGQTAWAGRRSPVVLLTAASSLAALVALVQTPGLNRYFGCTMLDPLSWLVVLGWAAAATVGAEAASQALARHRSRRTPPGEQPVPQTS
jgi:cation-transporting ATPase I